VLCPWSQDVVFPTHVLRGLLDFCSEKTARENTLHDLELQIQTYHDERRYLSELGQRGVLEARAVVCALPCVVDATYSPASTTARVVEDALSVVESHRAALS
jgi:hypothetical protein